MHGVRRPFFEPAKVREAVVSRLESARSAGEAVDYISFVPDGEPTIDIHLGQEIELLKPLGVKIAVISNASLIWREDVRNDLKKADWVSLKVDACAEETWRKINRPHGILNLKSILEGLLTFAGEFDGTLVTETMLVKGLNDDEKVIGGIADFLARLRPSKAYISVPIRPPAEDGVAAPDEKSIIGAHQAIRENVPAAELLIEYEGETYYIRKLVKGKKNNRPFS